jgi:hypothetical protein
MREASYVVSERRLRRFHALQKWKETSLFMLFGWSSISIISQNMVHTSDFLILSNKSIYMDATIRKATNTELQPNKMRRENGSYLNSGKLSPPT